MNKKTNLPRKKKASMFAPLVFIVGLSALVFLFIVISGKGKGINQEFGNKQFELFHTYNRGEKALLFVDSSVNLANRQAIYDFGKAGGFGYESKCGAFINSNYWQKGTESCYPEILAEYPQILGTDLNKILVTYNDAAFPLTSYDVQIKENYLVGISETELAFPIGMTSIPGSPLFILPTLPKDAKGKVEAITTTYGSYIEQELNNLPGNNKPTLSDAIGLITQESKGSSTAISPTGCVGLVQVCYCTAWAYTPSDFKPNSNCKNQGYTKQNVVVFQNIEPATCQNIPKGGRTISQCSVNPIDDRLKPELSMKFLVVNLQTLLQHYSKYTDGLKFAIAAYNGGQEVIDGAIKKTGKTDPLWGEVAPQITPNMITYFKNDIERQQNKPNEIRGYVSMVTQYSNLHKELISPSVIQKPSPPSSKSNDASSLPPKNFLNPNTQINSITGKATSPTSTPQTSTGTQTQANSQTSNTNPNNNQNTQTPDAKPSTPWQVSPSLDSYGIYKIRPSFRINPNYDLTGVYDKVMAASQYIVATCKDHEDVPFCLNAIMNDIHDTAKQQKSTNDIKMYSDDYEWNFGACINTGDAMFYDFAQSLQLCKDAKEDECTCDFNLPLPLNEDMEPIYFSARQSGNDMVLSYQDDIKFNNKAGTENFDNEDLSYTLTDVQLNLVSSEFATSIEYLPLNYFKIKASYDTDSNNKIFLDGLNIETQIHNDAKDSHDFPLPSTHKITFMKNGKYLYLIEPSDIINAKYTRKCEPQRKERFCAYTKDKKTAYEPFDLTENKINQRNISIQFALYIPDTLAPDYLKNLHAWQIDKSEDKVILEWDKGKESDIFKYVLYYRFGDSKFDDSLRPIIPGVIDMYKIYKQEFYSLDYQTDKIQIEAKNLEGYNHAKEKNILNYIVVAVDYEGNQKNHHMIDKITQMPNYDLSFSNHVLQRTLTDTLRPMMEGAFSAVPSGNQVKLTWQIPKNNEPDSNNEIAPLNDLAGYRLYDNDNLIENLVDKDVTEKILVNQPSGKHNYCIEAVDESWNSATPNKQVICGEITLS